MYLENTISTFAFLLYICLVHLVCFWVTLTPDRWTYSLFLGAPILFAFSISIVATVESQEVAVKKFLDQDLSGDALEQFRCEVSINIFEFYVIN